MTKAAHIMEKVADGWGWNLLHGALDVLGAVPIVGNVADLANAGVYGARGKYGDAALSMAAAVPIAGYGATAAKGAKWTHKGYKAVKGTSKTAPAILKAQTKAGKLPIKTKLTQNVAETVGKAPLPVQKVVARSNKVTSDAAKILQKVPGAGRLVNPASKFKTWGVNPIVRWRGAENIMTAGTQADIPGLREADAAYQGANQAVLNTLGLGDESTPVIDANLEGAKKDLDAAQQNLIQHGETDLEVEAANNAKKEQAKKKARESKSQKIMRTKSYNDLDNFLQNNQ